MALVLCTGVDRALITTRRLILEKAGHKVVAVTDETEVVAACKKQTFDVAVIGQAVSTHAKRQIMQSVRQYCPSAKILELYRFSLGKKLEDADSWLEVPTDVPEELAERVAALTKANDKKSH